MKRIVAAAEETPLVAFIDLVGSGYVELALELGIAKDRIDTIVDFPVIAKYGVKGDGGATAASAATLAEPGRRDLGGRPRCADPAHVPPRRLGRGAVVVILSDGWDRGDVDVLCDEMARVRRSAHRLVWPTRWPHTRSTSR